MYWFSVFWDCKYPPPPPLTHTRRCQWVSQSVSQWVREGWRLQNGWIFGKVPKGGGGHFQSKNLCCKIWTFKQGYLTMKLIQSVASLKKLQHNFPKMRGVKGRLELFRKFIRFGWGRLPLPSLNQVFLHRYPWDKQHCRVRFESFGHSTGTLNVLHSSYFSHNVIM